MPPLASWHRASYCHQPSAISYQPNWHALRSRIQLLCFLIFLVLPFINVIRFDIPAQRFYFFGQELWISKFGIIFFAMMFLMFVVVLMSVFLGRVFCEYLCPALYAAIALGSILLSIIFISYFFISYFVEPRQLRFGISTAGGICGAAVALIAFLDFAFVRQKFCTTVCPYGYLQGLLADDRTLLVQYQDPTNDCIDCKKCVARLSDGHRHPQLALPDRVHPLRPSAIASGRMLASSAQTSIAVAFVHCCYRATVQNVPDRWPSVSAPTTGSRRPRLTARST